MIGTSPRVVVANAVRRASPLLLPTGSPSFSVGHVIASWRGGWLAIDLWIYRNAAATALAGGDPWTSSFEGYRFAAPPPTVVAYLPFAILPPAAALALSAAILFGAAVFAVRRLRLPLWWLLFPPIVESLLVQNPDIVVLALLIAGGTLTGAAAPFVKIYGLVPLAIQGRLRAIAFACLLLLPTAPLWPGYLSHFTELQTVLSSQSVGGLSAWGTPFVVPVAVVLALIGRKASAWLAVPLLWPSTQLHYSSMALPALATRPLLAAAFSVANPLLAPVAFLIVGTLEVVDRRAGLPDMPRGVRQALGVRRKQRTQ